MSASSSRYLSLSGRASGSGAAWMTAATARGIAREKMRRIGSSSYGKRGTTFRSAGADHFEIALLPQGPDLGVGDGSRFGPGRSGVGQGFVGFGVFPRLLV